MSAGVRDGSNRVMAIASRPFSRNPKTTMELSPLLPSAAGRRLRAGLRLIRQLVLSGLAGGVCVAAVVGPATEPRVVDIAPVWSGYPVNFALLTRGETQFVAFYDAQRQMTVAQRRLGQTAWRFKKLPSHVEWDSHNALMLGLDRGDRLHLSGNMHNVPLIYFRATRPLDVDSLEAVHRMTGQEEQRVTYPVFLNGPQGELVFTYREGRSGRGDTLYNVYDEGSRSWRPLVSGPILSGEGRMNAYPLPPFRGPDGFYHLSWVWRDTGGADSNHDLSYARSRNLVQWETIDGRPLALPITLRSAGTIVDPVPVKGGIINSSGRVGFDAENRVVLAYHKYDAAGNTQMYLARFDNGAWLRYQASRWDYRWDFGKAGSLPFEIRHGSVTPRGRGLVIPIQHVKYGSGVWEIDPATMTFTTAERARGSGVPAALTPVRSTFPGMEVRWAEDFRDGPNAARFLPNLALGTHDPVYLIRWETLDFNSDKPRDPPWPEPVMLQVVELRRAAR